MRYHRIDVYIPGTHVEAVKQAMFEAGAGKIGNYDRCCFQVRGIGQFRPLEGADPFLGTPDRMEHAAEWKVEMVCPEDCVEDVIAALKQTHPYETPAFQHWPVELE